MRVATVSLLEEHPPIRLTFSSEFYRSSGPVQVAVLKSLAVAFAGLSRAAQKGLRHGSLPPLHKLQGCLPMDVTITKGRIR